MGRDTGTEWCELSLLNGHIIGRQARRITWLKRSRHGE